MNQPHILLKVAAVASSLLLAGGFVLYRAGAFEESPTPAGMPVDVAAAGVHESGLYSASSVPDSSLLHRSADTADTNDRKARNRERDTLRPKPLHFGGSKSAVPMIEYHLDTPGTQSSGTDVRPGMDTAPQRRRFMGGSKSLAPMIEPPVDSAQRSNPDQ